MNIGYIKKLKSDPFASQTISFAEIDTWLFLATIYLATKGGDIAIGRNGIPRVIIEVVNLATQGIVERCILLPTLAFLDECGYTKSIRFCQLPGTKKERHDMFHEVSSLSAALQHNKAAIFLSLIVLVPMDFIDFRMGGASNKPYEISLQYFCRSLLCGLLVMDFILGTAHLLSHHRLFKRWLWKYHARHHEKHINFFSVKFV